MAIGGPAMLDDPAVALALAESHLGGLPADVTSALFEGARREHARAASIVRDIGQPGPYLELLVGGFLRIFVRAPDGRTLTVRYLRRGNMSGAVSLFTPGYALAATVQALVDSEMVFFKADVVIGLAERDLRVARAVIDELSERVVQFVAEIPDNAFGTVRQRVARHLLDLASDQAHGERLVAAVNQQALADAVGSVREVVVRVLHDLRAQGVIRTGRDGIEVLVPAALVDDQFPTRRSSARPSTA
jgi:CRP/FNR family transcriptional regulator, cyclic AMP receptor protein